MKNYLDDLEVKSQTELLSPLLHHVFQPFSPPSFKFFLSIFLLKKTTIGDIENDAENDAFAFFWFIHEMRPLRMLACLQKTFSDEQGPSNLIVWKLPLRYKHVGNKNTDKALKEKKNKWSFENCYLNLKTGQPILEIKALLEYWKKQTPNNLLEIAT